MRTDEIFGLEVPVRCTGVPDEVLDPQATWADKEAYVAQAKSLAGSFRENFTKYKEFVTAGVAGAGPAK